MLAWHAGWRSSAGFVNHLFPDAFGAEDEFDEFARGAFATIGFGGVLRCAADFRGSIVNGDRESDALHDHQVGQVIAEEGDFRFLGAGLAQDILVSRNLVPLLLVDKFDIQFFAAAAKSGAAPPADEPGAKAPGGSEREALAVVRVKCLALERRTIRLGHERVPSISKCADDILPPH